MSYTGECKPGWLSSKPFRFLVGPDEQEFTIHSELVAKQSAPLRALVTNGMKESQEGCTRWPHVDVDTFQRISEYMYNGDFRSPCFEELTIGEPPRPYTKDMDDPDFEDNLLWITAWDKFRKSGKYKYTNFRGLYQPVFECGNCSAADEALVAIAKVHVVAQYYDMGTLMKISMGKLHSIMYFNATWAGCSKLLRFCTKEVVGKPLKDLAFDYATLGVRVLLYEDFREEHDYFHKLVSDHPMIALEIMKRANLLMFKTQI